MTYAIRPEETLPCYSVAIETPDGNMWVTVAERDGKPVQILINIGKCGSYTMAWADAVARLATRMLEYMTVHQIIEELSGITTSKLVRNIRGEVCRSGPEGVAQGLLAYRKEKFGELGIRKHREGDASID